MIPAQQPNTNVSIKEQYWARFYSPSQECVRPTTALKELECRNQAENARQTFESQWANKLATGWKPSEFR
jgi:hypothetical protein